jgi:hypothetical protein
MFSPGERDAIALRVTFSGALRGSLAGAAALYASRFDRSSGNAVRSMRADGDSVPESEQLSEARYLGARVVVPNGDARDVCGVRRGIVTSCDNSA